MSAGWRSEARQRLVMEGAVWSYHDPMASDLRRALDALDAVLALHAPYDDEMACRACTQSIPVPYPCRTVQAIRGDRP